MKKRSYIVLAEFKKELLDNGFANLPTKYSISDITPYQTIFRGYEKLFISSLLDDLSVYFHDFPLTFSEAIFSAEDEYAQGASICYIYAEFAGIKIVFKYLVFQDVINCYITGNISQNSLNELIGNDNKFISTLAQNYALDKQAHLYSF